VRPADPLILALATIHAARAVLLEDVDLGNRRITVAGRVHLLDEKTALRYARSAQQLLTATIAHYEDPGPAPALA
jgi:hypothetical protein